MPEILKAIARVQRRFLAHAVASAIALGGAFFALVFIITLVFSGLTRSTSLAIALSTAIVIALAIVLSRRRFSDVGAAQAIEAAHGSLDNLIVTAVELETHPRPVRAEIRDEIIHQASARASTIDVKRTIPIAQPIAIAVVILVGCAFVSRIGSASYPMPSRVPLVAALSGTAGTSFDVRVTPPAYTRRPAEVLRDPVQVTVLEGSRIQIPAVRRDWIATESSAIEVKTSSDAEAKFLSIVVTPDLPPGIRVVEPGKDAAFAQPRGQIGIRIQTTDDLGLTALSLKFTKASGGGENVSFTEGEVPLRIDRRGDQHWNAQASLDLESLGLADGDILVYRAIARDTNPRGAPVSSEQYLIEIGKNAEIADAGFALPSEEKKYAISQQMVIFKTQRLIEARNDKSAPSRTLGEGWMDQARGIAIEQRMVRAEIVFLGGGEVEDELEEAAKSDELTEGRLQNTGRTEMLHAINAMSRAEAQLNDGRLEDALVFEKQALASLERALDRRRYFLRTLPDRSRIDTNRRLTGERRDARSWERDSPLTPAPETIEGQRQLMRELAANVAIDARLAARLAAVDPTSGQLQKAAVALASARDDAARQAARNAAMAALTNHALRTLAATLPVELRRDPLAGQLAGELSPGKRQ